MAGVEGNGVPPRVTVSGDFLRAELLSLKDELKAHIDSRLEKKADAVVVDRLAADIDSLKRQVITRDGPVMAAIDLVERRSGALEEGTFNKAQQRAIQDIVAGERKTGHDRKITLISLATTVAAGAATVVYAIVTSLHL